MNGMMKNVRTIEYILEVSNENTANLILSRTLHHSDNYNANIITCYRKDPITTLYRSQMPAEIRKSYLNSPMIY